MAFMTTYNMMQSEGLRQRITAAAAAAGETNPEMWFQSQKWAMVPKMVTPPQQDGSYQYWWQVWEYAKAQQDSAGINGDIGARTDVILDAWIANTVGAHMADLGPESASPANNGFPETPPPGP